MQKKTIRTKKLYEQKKDMNEKYANEKEYTKEVFN